MPTIISMDPIFLWIESSALSVWLRESPSVWAFPAALCAHAIGMGLAVGFSGMTALRVLGWAPEVPLGELRRYAPLMWSGFWLNAVSGIALLIAYPTKALTNPWFYVKMGCVITAALLVRRLVSDVVVGATRATTAQRAARLAGWSLACWTVAIGTGRFLAYTYVRYMVRE